METIKNIAVGADCNPPLPTTPTAREIAEHRFGAEALAKYKMQYKRPLAILEVDGKIALLRPVTAEEVGVFSMMAAGSTGMAKASEYLIRELWLDGDSELVDDEEYFISAMMQVQKSVELKKSSFTKL